MTRGSGASSRSSCLMASLARAELGGVLPGLMLKDGLLEPSPTHFACCGGRGLRLNAEGTITYACSLPSRLCASRKITALYQALSGEESLSKLSPELRRGDELTRLLQRLAAIAAGSQSRGLAWLTRQEPALAQTPPPRAAVGPGPLPQTRGAAASDSLPALRNPGARDARRQPGDASATASAPRSAPGGAASPGTGSLTPAGARTTAAARARPGACGVGSGRATPAGPSTAATADSGSGTPLLWAAALAATWRFGLRPHVVVLGKTAPADLLPKASEPSPHLLCIGDVEQLWDPYQAEKFETLISYAYSAMTPVFLHLHVGAQAPAPSRGYGHVGQHLGRVLAAARAKSPLAWLNPAILPRLAAVTSGLDEQLASAELALAAARGAALPERPSPPRPRS